jgi:hypothetical protein
MWGKAAEPDERSVLALAGDLRPLVVFRERADLAGLSGSVGHTAGVEPTWLDEPTVDALRAALRTVAPDLAEATIVPRGLEPSGDPQYCTASAVVDGGSW